MRKLRDKWFWALSLAILVHIGAFFIFYLNIDRTDAVEAASTTSSINNSLIVTDIDDQDYSLESKASVSTLTETKHSDYIVEDSMETDTAPLKKEALRKDDRVINSSRDNKNDREVLSESTEKVIQQKNTIEYQTDEDPASLSSDNNKVLDSIKNDAGLLDIDIPTQKHQIEIEGEHLLKKSEAEEVNSQLSAAINEVKKRNQQKIDELERRKDTSSIKNN